jgi:hypothetical protein
MPTSCCSRLRKTRDGTGPHVTFWTDDPKGTYEEMRAGRRVRDGVDVRGLRIFSARKDPDGNVFELPSRWRAFGVNGFTAGPARARAHRGCNYALRQGVRSLNRHVLRSPTCHPYWDRARPLFSRSKANR